MSQETPYFVHTGKTPVISIILMLVFGVMAALVLSVIYGYAISYIPFIYLNFFITLGFGLLVGVAIGIGGKIGKARKPGLYGLIGLFVGLFAEYAGWVAWFYASSGQDFLPLQADTLLTSMQYIAQTGAWSIFGWTPTGLALYGIWLVEGLMIVGASSLIALAYIESTPFCEHCNTWVDNEQTKSGFKEINAPDSLKEALENGQLDLVTNLEKADSAGEKSTDIEINGCSSCDNSNYLSLSSVTITLDDKGNASKDTDKFISNLKISGDQFSRLAALD